MLRIKKEVDLKEIVEYDIENNIEYTGYIKEEDQMSEEELYKLLNIPYKPWIELTNEEIQLFEKNNNYIKQLQQENTQLKQQLKDKDEKISKIKNLVD